MGSGGLAAGRAPCGLATCRPTPTCFFFSLLQCAVFRGGRIQHSWNGRWGKENIQTTDQTRILQVQGPGLNFPGAAGTLFTRSTRAAAEEAQTSPTLPPLQPVQHELRG